MFDFQSILNKLVKCVHVKIGKELGGKISDRYSLDAKRCTLSLS